MEEKKGKTRKLYPKQKKGKNPDSCSTNMEGVPDGRLSSLSAPINLFTGQEDVRF